MVSVAARWNTRPSGWNWTRFTLSDGAVAVMVTGASSAPAGIDSACGPILITPPAGPTVCVAVAVGIGLKSTAFPVPPAVLALIVTGCTSAPEGTTNTCGPIRIVPPAEPIVCFRDVEGSLLHCSRPLGVDCADKSGVIPVGSDRSDAHLPERSATPRTTKTETTRVWRTIGKTLP